jgi:predicted ribosomally synthesized peptide with nif11-like leader
MEVKMTIDSAQLFVQKMREDTGFRNTVQDIGDKTELREYIENKGYAFDECDLVKAMAVCITEPEAVG